MLLAALLALQGDPPYPPIDREFRAAWVATVDNIDWPDHRGEPVTAQKRELLAIVERAHFLHLNALILQVRPSADALYPSKIEPWSEYLTSRQGMAPRPLWDPLAFAIAAAHRDGIQIHAWFNPYRAQSPAQKGPDAPNHISRTNPEVVKMYDRQLWMDPGEPVVQKRTREVIMDVVRRYDIDGVHIDDYFYPYKDDKKTDFPDSASWARYEGPLKRADWRRQNVDRFVEQIYKSIKRVKPWVMFGISPFGIYRPGVPKGIVAHVDQYADLYADVRKWLREGWCDYLTPQLYWPIDQKPQAFGTLLRWWDSQNVKGRHIWPGSYTTKVDPKVGGWRPEEILDQISLTRGTHKAFRTTFSSGLPQTPREHGATGNVHFSFREFTRDGRGLDERLVAGPYARIAVPPASPWLAQGPPPTLRVIKGRLAASKQTRFAAWTSATGRGWTPWQVGDLRSAQRAGRYDRIAVVAIDRYGRLSRVVVRPAG